MGRDVRSGRNFAKRQSSFSGGDGTFGVPNEPEPRKNRGGMYGQYSYKTPGEAGIDETQVSTEGDIHFDFDIATDIPPSFDVSKANFLVCDIRMKNINFTSDDMNITMLSLVYLMPDEQELKLVGYPAYFSESIDILGNPNYYHFELPVDQSMDAKLGWWVDLEQCKKENLYVMYNHGGMEEIQQCWKLEL